MCTRRNGSARAKVVVEMAEMAVEEEEYQIDKS